VPVEVDSVAVEINGVLEWVLPNIGCLGPG
jgi:hypothetical protein